MRANAWMLPAALLLATPLAAQQGTIEVQPLEPLIQPAPGATQESDGGGIVVRPLEPLGEEDGGFVTRPAPESDESDILSEGFDEGAFGEEGAAETDEAAEAGLEPEAEVGLNEEGLTEDGLWALEEEDGADSLFGTRDRSGSGWLEPDTSGSDSALIEEDGGDSPRFLVAPPTGRGLFGPARPRPLPQVATVPAEGAELRQLDKMTGATRTVTMEAGEERKLGRLRVVLEGCHMPQEGGTQGTRAFLRVWDPQQEGEDLVFSGWMFAESPALSALDHPRYDIWVLGCTPVEAAGAEPKKEPGEG